MNTRRIAAVGTGVFLLGFLVLLPFYGWLGSHDHRIWLWTCLAGAVLGIVGWSLMVKHKRDGRTI
ncbi:MAG: DUF2530 domain-containing protein [Actinomycetota bacterium]|nr:DUF2530 domain-containing protein [Actinomycetota bacterium]